MKKAALVVGARPQFIKTAPLILELGRFFQVVLIHTGQHYDFMMSDTFFDELKIPFPDYHLDSAGTTVGKQISRMIDGLESIFSYEKPDISIVVGDTNSTLSGAVASAKLGIPLVHVEAGVRSTDKRLPEQINRVMTDAVADCFLCPSPSAVENLKREGKQEQVHDTGDVIYDSLRMFERQIPDKPSSFSSLPAEFALATIHRAEAVDIKANLECLMESLMTSPVPVIFPIHPRTKKMMTQFGLLDKMPSNVIISDPVGYSDILALIRLSKCVITDSGGIQREAAFLGKRVYIARSETEWIEFVDSGWLKICGYNFDLSHNSLKPPSRNETIEHLFRPAAKSMAELINKI